MEYDMFLMPTPDPMIDVQLLRRPVKVVAIDPFPLSAGAECLFLGRTRVEVHPQHGELQRLSYEAYEPMARQILLELAQYAARTYDCLAVRIHHAIGEVPAGEASVLVQTVCAHRGSAFDACRLLIDRLKHTAPVWKMEQWADGTSWSEGNPVHRKPSNEFPPTH